MTIKDIEDRLAAYECGEWSVETSGTATPFLNNAPTDIRLLLDIAKAAREYLDSQTLNGRITPPYHKSSGRLATALDALERPAP